VSEHITHTAICQDVQRLAACLGSERVPPAFDAIWAANEAESQLGGITRQADNFSVDIIGYHRDQAKLPEDQRDPQADAKLAFVLGALTHRSVDRHAKPIFEYFKRQPDYPGFNQCTIYLDVHVLREVYGEDESLFPKGLLHQHESPSREKLETLFHHVMRRSLVQLHTFKPQAKDGIDALQEWLGKFLAASQEFKISVEEYIQAASDPDPKLWQAYVVETKFYNPDAELIKLAASARKGEKPSAEAILDAAGRMGEKDGRYAMAMARALTYVQAAGRYWRGETGEQETREALDIGVPERSMIWTPAEAA
jgi:hypothetical protein